MKLNAHHPDRKRFPNWTIPVSQSFHMFFWRLWEKLPATEQNYAILQGEIDAMKYKALEMRRELDNGRG